MTSYRQPHVLQVSYFLLRVIFCFCISRLSLEPNLRSKLSAKQNHDATSPPVQTIKATSQLGDPRVTYNLEDGMVPETNMPVRFYLSPNREDGSTSILVSEPLDYETTPIFSLRVRAQNVAAVPLAAFTTVYINITGVICTLLKWLLFFDMKLKLE